MQKITLKYIAEMSDEEVYKLSMPRPNQPQARGFMLSLEHFENKEEMAECMYVLMKRLLKIKVAHGNQLCERCGRKQKDHYSGGWMACMAKHNK